MSNLTSPQRRVLKEAGEISRRQFLGKVGKGAAAAAGLGMTGCAIHGPNVCHDTTHGDSSSFSAPVLGGVAGRGEETSQYRMCRGACCVPNKKGEYAQCSCSKQCGCWTNEEHNKRQHDFWNDPEQIRKSAKEQSKWDW